MGAKVPQPAPRGPKPNPSPPPPPKRRDVSVSCGSQYFPSIRSPFKWELQKIDLLFQRLDELMLNNETGATYRREQREALDHVIQTLEAAIRVIEAETASPHTLHPATSPGGGA